MLRKLKQNSTSTEPTVGRKSERAVAPVSLIAAGFTAACCLGVSAALSFATALGATFMTRDATLEPILIATLLVTCAGSALTYWRHRHTIGPLVLTVAASVWIYLLVFGLDSGMHDNMNDAHGSTAMQGGLTGGRQALVWLGIMLLISAQVWDLVRVRQRHVQGEPLAPAEGGSR